MVLCMILSHSYLPVAQAGVRDYRGGAGAAPPDCVPLCPITSKRRTRGSARLKKQGLDMRQWHGAPPHHAFWAQRHTTRLANTHKCIWIHVQVLRFSFIEHRAGAPVAASADQIYPIVLESSPNLLKHLRAGHRDLRLAQRIAHRACSPSHRPDQLPAVVLRVVPWPSETPGASPPRVAHGQR